MGDIFRLLGPAGFMFTINQRGKDEVVAKCDRPQTNKVFTNTAYVFTEHGAVMLASVFNSERTTAVLYQHSPKIKRQEKSHFVHQLVTLVK